MSLSVLNRRASLPHARRALQQGRLRVGFIGGSITESLTDDPDLRYRSYSDHVSNGLMAAFPAVSLTFQSAGIGATDSTLGAFRLKQDILDPGCDLLFVEYAVNDGGMEPGLRQAAREGLLRQALTTGHCDVVPVYTYCQDMYDDLIHDRLPPSVADFEVLAEHYRLSSVFMGLHALNCVKQGILRWEEWLPDRLHPNEAGSRFYAQPVLDFVISELQGKDDTSFVLPAPLSRRPWERLHTLPLSDISWRSPWKLCRFTRFIGHEEVLMTSAIGAELTIPFEGTGLLLGMRAGIATAAFDYRLDDGDWQSYNYEAIEWMGNDGWYHAALLAEGLAPAPHTLTLRTRHAGTPITRGTRMALCLLGVFDA